MFNRREFGIGCVAAAVAGKQARAQAQMQAPIDAGSEITRLEHSLGGRIGVAAIDTGSGRRIAHRSGERFAMCSTFKWLLAAAILARTESGSLALESRISFTAKDLPAHSPVTHAFLAAGGMTVAQLCAAAVEESDNGAANLLLRQIGGPGAITNYARSIGDTVTRLDRLEPALNENRPGDPRDTTTPDACVADMGAVLSGSALSPGSRDQLAAWMKNCRTGLDRLRAGLPPDWTVADKTGTGTGSGRTSAVNDIAVVWPPDGPPILIASYISGSAQPVSRQNAAHAQIARIVAAALG